jgi:putative peptidoglycan binding protein
MPRTRTRRPTSAKRSPRKVARAAAPGSDAPHIALVNVPADGLEPDGFHDFRVRGDLAPSYQRVRARVRALGGVITSSGALRDLHEPATPGRSRTSLHYTGRAIDLYIESGARTSRDPYLVVASQAGTTPTWTIYCESRDPHPDDESYNASLIEERTLDCAIWKKGVGLDTIKRTARVFNLTQLFMDEGWKPISARSDWKTNYLSCEWWHFQNESGLRLGVSLFGDDLLKVWPRPLVESSGLALDAVWRGRYFQIPSGAGTPAPGPPPSPSTDTTRFIQTALNSVDRESLDVDGKFGSNTRDALKRFQEHSGLPVTGLYDAATEAALHDAVQPVNR